MSDFKAKMHQIRFWVGLCPRPCWGSLQHSPEPIAGFQSACFWGEGEVKREVGKGRGEGGKGSTVEKNDSPSSDGWLRAWKTKSHLAHGGRGWPETSELWWSHGLEKGGQLRCLVHICGPSFSMQYSAKISDCSVSKCPAWRAREHCRL